MEQRAPRTDEPARLAALESYDILDTEAETGYDALTRLAADLCGVPISLISLIDDRRQWFKSNFGLGDARSTPREQAFCAHAIASPEIFEVENALLDARFVENPLVTGDPNIRFYAGMPLIDDDGFALGTLCVIDNTPRTLSETQRRQLGLLALAVTELIKRRKRVPPTSELPTPILESALELSHDPLVIQTVNADGKRVIAYVNTAFEKLFGYKSTEIVGTSGEILYGDSANFVKRAQHVEAVRASGFSESVIELFSKDEAPLTVEMRTREVQLEAGKVAYWLSNLHDITSQLATLRELREVMHAVEHATDLIFVIDSRSGMIVDGHGTISFVNDAFTQTMQYAREAIVGKTVAKLFGPGSDPSVIAEMDAAIEAVRAFAVEILSYRADGTAIRLEVHASPILECGLLCSWIVVARDVSERHRMQQQLLVLSEAFEHANDGIVVYEVDPAQRRKPRPIYVNDALVRMTGCTRAELHVSALRTGPLSDQTIVARIIQARETATPLRERLLCYRNDDSTYWVEIEARTVYDARERASHWVTIQRDISEIVLREQELERERQTLAALLDTSRALFSSLDSTALYPAVIDAVECVVPALATTLSLQEITGDPFRECAAQSNLSVVAGRAAFALPAIADGAPLLVEARFANGRVEEYERDALALVAEICATAARNVSLYRELANQRADVSELSAVKSDLIAMLAHDFNNPLASIKGHIEMLADGMLEGEDASASFAFVLEATRRLIALARDTLAYSQLESGMSDLQRATVDVRELVTEIATTSPMRVTVHGADGIEALGDPTLLREVFANLIGNALKYSPEDAPVTVTCAVIGDAIEVTVADRGIGIPADELAEVFKRFSRASNARAAGFAGTGFGLYLVQATVERHGGTVTVESTVGVGSRFTVRLPKAQRTRPTTRRLTLFAGSGSDSGYTAQALRAAGFAVRAIEDPLLVGAIESYDPTALIVLDATSAEAACVQLAQSVRTNRLYIVAAEARERFARSAPQAHIVDAPFVLAELLAAIESVVAR